MEAREVKVACKKVATLKVALCKATEMLEPHLMVLSSTVPPLLVTATV